MSVLVESLAEGVLTLTLNRPDFMNALSRELRADLSAALRRGDADPAVRVVVITGAGDRAFSAGLDRGDLPAEIADVQRDIPTSPEVNPALAISQVRVPVIAAVNGLTMTGGLEVVAACDFAICSDQARFADTHARLGLAPMWGLSQRLPRLIGPARAKQMSLTGAFISAAQALAWGLVTEVTSQQALSHRANEIASTIALAGAEALHVGRNLINAGLSLTLNEGLDLEQRWARDVVKARPREAD